MPKGRQGHQGHNMPRQKTHSGAAKRFRRTSSGFKHRGGHRNHNLSKRSTRQKRQCRGLKPLASGDEVLVRKLLPGKAR